MGKVEGAWAKHRLASWFLPVTLPLSGRMLVGEREGEGGGGDVKASSAAGGATSPGLQCGCRTRNGVEMRIVYKYHRAGDGTRHLRTQISASAIMGWHGTIACTGLTGRRPAGIFERRLSCRDIPLLRATPSYVDPTKDTTRLVPCPVSKQAVKESMSLDGWHQTRIENGWFNQQTSSHLILPVSDERLVRK